MYLIWVVRRKTCGARSDVVGCAPVGPRSPVESRALLADPSHPDPRGWDLWTSATSCALAASLRVASWRDRDCHGPLPPLRSLTTPGSRNGRVSSSLACGWLQTSSWASGCSGACPASARTNPGAYPDPLFMQCAAHALAAVWACSNVGSYQLCFAECGVS